MRALNFVLVLAAAAGCVALPPAPAWRSSGSPMSLSVGMAKKGGGSDKFQAALEGAKKLVNRAKAPGGGDLPWYMTEEFLFGPQGRMKPAGYDGLSSWKRVIITVVLVRAPPCSTLPAPH
jgi:hypothetical protein